MDRSLLLNLLIILALLIAIVIITLTNNGECAEHNFANLRGNNTGMVIYYVDGVKVGGILKTYGNQTTTIYYIWNPRIFMWKSAGVEIYDNTKHKIIADTFTLNDKIKSGLSIL